MKGDKYVYRPHRTIIRDLGDGKVWILYVKQTKTVKDTLLVGEWAVAIVKKIMAEYPGKKMIMLSEMPFKTPPPSNRQIRETYQESLESDFFGRMAFVTPLHIYLALRIVQVLLLQNQENIVHFSKRKDALEWLGWDESLVR